MNVRHTMGVLFYLILWLFYFHVTIWDSLPRIHFAVEKYPDHRLQPERVRPVTLDSLYFHIE